MDTTEECSRGGIQNGGAHSDGNCVVLRGIWSELVDLGVASGSAGSLGVEAVEAMHDHQVAGCARDSSLRRGGWSAITLLQPTLIQGLRRGEHRSLQNAVGIGKGSMKICRKFRAHCIALPEDAD